MSIEELELFRYFTSSFSMFNKRDQNQVHLDDRNCIMQHWLLNRDLSYNWKITFIERIKTDHFDFEISIEGHLSVNVLTECSFACSRSTGNTDDDSLDRFFNNAIFPDFKKMLHWHEKGYIYKLKFILKLTKVKAFNICIKYIIGFGCA